MQVIQKKVRLKMNCYLLSILFFLITGFLFDFENKICKLANFIWKKTFAVKLYGSLLRNLFAAGKSSYLAIVVEGNSRLPLQ